MEHLLIKFVTYKLINVHSFFNKFLNQPVDKLFLSTCLLILIIGISAYVLFRTVIQHRIHPMNTVADSSINIDELLISWRNQNREICDNVVELCTAFVNSYAESVKIPDGLKSIKFLSQASSKLIYNLNHPSQTTNNCVNVPLRITAQRLSFSGLTYAKSQLSHITFVLANLSLDVVLNLSFRNSKLTEMKTSSSKPSFSFLIDSSEPIEHAKQDFTALIEDIVLNVPFIWKHTESLLANQLPKDEFIDQQSFATPTMLELLENHFESGILSSISTEKSAIDGGCSVPKTVFNFDSAVLVNVASPVLVEAVPFIASPMPQSLYDGKDNVMQADNGKISRNTSPSRLGPIVLAHNPSLKIKLAAGISRKPTLNRSASDDEDDVIDSGGPPLSLGSEAEGEQVPLDPIVHPSVGEDDEEVMGRVNRSTNNSQRRKQAINDVLPMHERVAPSLASKNLLVKVVKADFIELKNTSDAYCVVELDEPYQRHATHVVPPSDQLFWDQHLLFDLNSNSKRAAFEVFELSRKKKSISRGYAEVHLPDLLTSAIGAPGCTELLRCIPLDVKHQSSSSVTAATAAIPGKWEHAISPMSSFISLAIRKPSITAEFHFMERIVDDPFSVCKGRSALNSPTPISKLRAKAKTSNDSSNSIMLLSHISDSTMDTGGAATTTVTTVAPSGGNAPLSFKQAYEVASNTRRTSDSGVSGAARSLQGFHGGKTSETETLAKLNTPQEDDVEVNLKRSTSTRGSRLFEPAFDNLRDATNLRSRLSGFGRSSTATVTHPSRSSSIKRRKRRKSLSRSANECQMLGMGLLGPSSQLAGMVAGLTAASVETADTTIDPSTAAAVASAVAVAGATGRADGRNQGGAVGLKRRTARTDSLFDSDPSDLSSLNYSGGEGASSTLVTKHDPIVRYAAPAANIAESPGTYSAQLQTRRSDSSGGRILSMFKLKKKPSQGSGVARLLYLENLEGSEFDAISTEGYQRIIKGDHM